MANVAFSLCAALASLAVSILAALKGVWIVTILFGMLAAGFSVRASERYRRGARR